MGRDVRCRRQTLETASRQLQQTPRRRRLDCLTGAGVLLSFSTYLLFHAHLCGVSFSSGVCRRPQPTAALSWQDRTKAAGTRAVPKARQQERWSICCWPHLQEPSGLITGTSNRSSQRRTGESSHQEQDEYTRIFMYLYYAPSAAATPRSQRP
jgi:hypothetical protein